jgi:hypothetical protein
MTSLERALADYRKRCAEYKLDNYPVIWAGHYTRHTSKQITANDLPPVPEPIPQVVLGIMSPFGACPEIDSSWLVIDTTRMPGDLRLDRILLVSCLVATEKGVHNKNWKVNAEGVAHPSFYEIPNVNRALSEIMNLRLTSPTYSFDDAFNAALEIGKELYTA